MNIDKGVGGEEELVLQLSINFKGTFLFNSRNVCLANQPVRDLNLKTLFKYKI